MGEVCPCLCKGAEKLRAQVLNIPSANYFLRGTKLFRLLGAFYLYATASFLSTVFDNASI